MHNRIAKHFEQRGEAKPAGATDSAWRKRCDEIAAELEVDRAALDAGTMTVEEFDDKW